MLASRRMRHAVGRRRRPAARPSATAVGRPMIVGAARRARSSVSSSGSMMISLAVGVDRDQLAGPDERGWRREARPPRARRASAPESRCDTCGCRRRWRSRARCVQSTCAASDGVSSSAISTDDSSISLQQIARRRGALAQVHPQPADEVGDVALALAQVGIGDLVEDGAEFLEHLLDRPLRVHALLADDRRRPRHEHRVVEHQQLRVEERGQLGSAPPRDTRADVDQLLARSRAGSAPVARARASSRPGAI